MPVSLKLFVLHYALVDAYAFFLARDERDLFDRCHYLIDDEVVSEALDHIPREKRSDAAVANAMQDFTREVIAQGSIRVNWSQAGTLERGPRQYNGEIVWNGYEVSEEEIAFLRKLGMLKNEAAAERQVA